MVSLLSPKDVGEALSPLRDGEPVPTTTVRNWLTHGKLRGVRVGGRVFITLTDLGEFLRANNPTAVLVPLAERFREAGRDKLAEQLLPTQEGVKDVA